MSEIFSSGLNRTLNKMSATEIILLVVREGYRPGMGPQRSFGDKMFCLYRWMFQGHMYMGWSKPPLCSLYSVEGYCTHSGPLGPHYFHLHGSSFEWNCWQILTTDLVVHLVENLPAMGETWFGSLGWKDLLEKGKATHSSILAWRITWTLKGWQRVRHDWVSLSLFTVPHNCGWLNLQMGHRKQGWLNCKQILQQG